MATQTAHSLTENIAFKLDQKSGVLVGVRRFYTAFLGTFRISICVSQKNSNKSISIESLRHPQLSMLGGKIFTDLKQADKIIDDYMSWIDKIDKEVGRIVTRM